jgi:hypothetical protein
MHPAALKPALCWNSISIHSRWNQIKEKNGHAEPIRVAAFFCLENFGQLLQDPISIVLIFDGEFAFPQDRVEVEIDLG